MTPTQVIALINQYIVSNNMGSITGPIMNTILQAIVGLFATPTSSPARIVSISALTITLNDYAIALQRSTGLSPFSASLPSGAAIGQEFVIQDVSGNCNAFPATIVAPAGALISGRSQYVMDQDFITARFRYYGVNVFGVEAA